MKALGISNQALKERKEKEMALLKTGGTVDRSFCFPVYISGKQAVYRFNSQVSQKEEGTPGTSILALILHKKISFVAPRPFPKQHFIMRGWEVICGTLCRKKILAILKFLV